MTNYCINNIFVDFILLLLLFNKNLNLLFPFLSNKNVYVIIHRIESFFFSNLGKLLEKSKNIMFKIPSVTNLSIVNTQCTHSKISTCLLLVKKILTKKKKNNCKINSLLNSTRI